MSKAKERPNRTRTGHFPECADIIRSLDTFRRADSVNTNVCLKGVAEFSYVSREEGSCLDTTFSRNLDRNGGLDIGLNKSEPALLGPGYTTPSLKQFRNTAEKVTY